MSLTFTVNIRILIKANNFNSDKTHFTKKMVMENMDLVHESCPRHLHPVTARMR